LTPDRPRAVRVVEEGQPAGAALAAGDLNAEDLAVPVSVDAGRREDVDGHHPDAFADLQHQGVGAMVPDVWDLGT
jgi:hypothetical protein